MLAALCKPEIALVFRCHRYNLSDSDVGVMQRTSERKETCICERIGINCLRPARVIRQPYV